MIYALPPDNKTLWLALRGAHPHLVFDGVGCLIGGFTISRSHVHIGSVGIIVDTQFRGLGFGKVIMRHAEAYARTLGITVLRMDIYCDNDAMMSLANQAGYREFRWFERNLREKEIAPKAMPDVARDEK